VRAAVISSSAEGTDGGPEAGRRSVADARTVLITGANKGIGCEKARQFSAVGLRI